MLVKALNVSLKISVKKEYHERKEISCLTISALERPQDRTFLPVLEV